MPRLAEPVARVVADPPTTGEPLLPSVPGGEAGTVRVLGAEPGDPTPAPPGEPDVVPDDPGEPTEPEDPPTLPDPEPV